MKHRITLNKPDRSEKLSRFLIGKLEADSRAEVTQRQSNMLFKLTDHQNFFQKSRASIVINYSPAPKSHFVAIHFCIMGLSRLRREFINSGHPPFTTSTQHAN